MGTIADTATAVVDHLRAPGPAGRLRRASTASGRSPRTSFARRSASARAVAVVERTDEPAAARQPADPRGQGGAVRRTPRRATMVPRVRSVSAGPRLARRRAPATCVAVFDWLADHRAPADSATPSLGIRHPLALERATARPAAGGRLQPARPLDRRLRIGHDQQAHRDARRRAVRPARPGLSALRLGEEGPADDLLPDHRRRSAIRQHAELEHVDFVPLHDVAAFAPGRSARRPGRRRHGVRPVAARRSRRRSGPRSRPRPARRSSPGGSGVAALDTAGARPAPRPAPGPRPCGMQGVALVGVFLRV